MDSWITDSLPGAIAYASSLLGDRQQGEDIVHDCICRLLGRATYYDLPRDGRKLLFRAVTNACLNLRTRRRKTVSLDERGRTDHDSHWEMEDRSSLPPPTLAMAEELSKAIDAGLQKLPLRQRSALELSSLGYHHDEIASMLSIRATHVRVLLFRGRRSMAKFLNARFFGEVMP